MLKSLTGLLAFFLGGLGPPSLSALPPVASPHGPQTVKIVVSPETLQDLVGRETRVAYPAPFLQVGGTVFRQATRLHPCLQADLELLLKKCARQHGVDENLVRAVLRQESGGNPMAVSPKGAMGLMQLMPGTAVLMGVANPFDPEENLAGGVKYLKLCLNRFHQDPILALAAYNAGPERVEQYGGVPPFPETQQYVASILGYGPGPNSRGKFAIARKQPQPQEPDSHQKSGLDWRLPRSTWKIAAPQAKVVAPQWKVRLSGLPPAQKAQVRGAVSPNQPGGLDPRLNKRLSQGKISLVSTP